MVIESGSLKRESYHSSKELQCLYEDTAYVLPVDQLGSDGYIFPGLISCKGISVCDGSTLLLMHIFSVRENFEKILGKLIDQNLEKKPLTVEISDGVCDREGFIEHKLYPQLSQSYHPSFSLLSEIFGRIPLIQSLKTNRAFPYSESGIIVLRRAVFARVFNNIHSGNIEHSEIGPEIIAPGIISVGENIYPDPI